MNLFRLFLLAAGLAIFLIVRLVTSFESATDGSDGFPPSTPKATPSESPGSSHPFPQGNRESAQV